MIKKIKQWYQKRKLNKVVSVMSEVDYYTRSQVEAAYALGVQDGRKEGLTVARQQAMESLRNIVKQQNR